MSAFEEFSHRTAMSESGPDASNAEAGTALVRAPATSEKAVGEGRLSYRSCSSRVYGQQPAGGPLEKWRIHTLDLAFSAKSAVLLTEDEAPLTLDRKALVRRAHAVPARAGRRFG